MAALFKNIRICHLTSVHRRDDVRIYLRECNSLASSGCKITLIVADGKGNDLLNDIEIIDVGNPGGRIGRVFISGFKVFNAAKNIKPDIYHIHDPELIPGGLFLVSKGCRVVFDSHEDFPKQLLSKPYLNKNIARLFSKIAGVGESFLCSHFSGIIAATPLIESKFRSINPQTISVCNYPDPDELFSDESHQLQKNEVSYIGSISESRGVFELVQAMALIRPAIRLNLCGNFSEPDFFAKVKAADGYQKVNELGFVGRVSAKKILRRSFAGIVTLHPTASYIESLPIKMFEYMSAGIPVIASDFPLWRKIVQEADCGVLVDPLNPVQIAEAIMRLWNSPDECRRLGSNGRKAVLERYNWESQKIKLLNFYSGLCT